MGTASATCIGTPGALGRPPAKVRNNQRPILMQIAVMNNALLGLIRVAALACGSIFFLSSGVQAQTSAVNSAPTDPVSVQSFFRKPVLSQVRLSPSGRWLAALVTKPGERTKLLVMDVDNKAPAQIVAAYTKYDVSDPAWVNDDLLVFSVDDDTDRSREANWKGQGLVSVQRNGDGQRVLIKRLWETEFPATGVAPLEANHHFVAMGRPRHRRSDRGRTAIRRQMGGSKPSLAGIERQNGRATQPDG